MRASLLLESDPSAAAQRASGILAAVPGHPAAGLLLATARRKLGDPAAAATQSYAALWGTVQRQAAMRAFVDTFRAMAIVFLLVLPFLLIMRRPKHHRAAGPMH